MSHFIAILVNINFLTKIVNSTAWRGRGVCNPIPTPLILREWQTCGVSIPTTACIRPLQKLRFSPVWRFFVYCQTIKTWKKPFSQSIHLYFQEGNFSIDGVPGTGAEILVDFLNPIAGDYVLPSGNVIDYVNIPGFQNDLEVSMVCSGNPVIFIDAKSVGLKGNEISLPE